MNLFRSSIPAARLLAAVACAAPGIALAGMPYELGPVGNALLANPLPSTSVRYGTVMASGDFNDDSVSDLAIVPYGNTQVRILLGQDWDVGTLLPVTKFAESGFTIPFQMFTTAMVSGDFDGDGDDELAIGNDDYSGTASGAGQVIVMRRSGADWVLQETIEQGSNGYQGVAEVGDEFGSSLAVGDFDDDGYEDLAIGAKGEDVGDVNGAGAVMIAYGSSSGITGARDILITRNGDGLTVPPTIVESYGTALASGDFNDDGYDDIAIGATRGRCPNGVDSSGAVIMMLGSASGIVNTGTRQFRPGVLGVQGSCTDNIVFGRALVSGRFDSGGTSDLAIATGANTVHVLYGDTAGGLQATGDQRFTPASLPGGTIADSRFGITLAAGRLSGNPFDIFGGRESLAIGATFDTVGGLTNAGSVSVIPGGSSGLQPAASVRWTRSAALAIGPPVVANDIFGAALATGDFNNDGQRDLAIGVPYDDDGSFADAGAVQVLYSSESIFRDGFNG